MLHHLVEADPAAWTADIPQARAILARVKLGAFYLAATATAAPTLPAKSMVAAAQAALALRRSLPTGGQQDATAVLFADQALFDLLALVWHAGAVLAEGLPAVLDHLHDLAEPLALPTGYLTDDGSAPKPAEGLPV
ncbi:hypothetical protein ABTY00_34410 [Streptomyces microflavus]|uniref:hypothetical protein n=1 Tax=Streptomyces microflavus TaxID=1919 RepID=UPI00332654B1